MLNEFLKSKLEPLESDMQIENNECNITSYIVMTMPIRMNWISIFLLANEIMGSTKNNRLNKIYCDKKSALCASLRALLLRGGN